jgi:N-acyl homoserine lactone hydrolase
VNEFRLAWRLSTDQNTLFYPRDGFVMKMRLSCRRGGPCFGLTAPSASAQSEKTGVDWLYVLDCGIGHATDQSRWSPGVNVGVPLDVIDNCYLIHHAHGYLLWDTGIP